MDHQIDAKFDRAVKKMLALPLKLEELRSTGSGLKPSRAKALGHSFKSRAASKVFSELDFLFQPWMLVRAS